MKTVVCTQTCLTSKLLFCLLHTPMRIAHRQQCLFVTEFLPLLQLCHVKETVSVFSGQLKLRGQREHGLIEVPQNSFDRASVLMAVVNVVIQADKLPVVKKKEKKEVKADEASHCAKQNRNAASAHT